MLDHIEEQRKIPLLIATALLLIILSIIGFGIVVVSRMNNLNANFQQVYTHTNFVSKSGLEAHVTLTKIHNLMLSIILQKNNGQATVQIRNISVLDNNLREYIKLVNTEFSVIPKKTTKLEYLLNDWKDKRSQLLVLTQDGRREQAIKLASSKSFAIYMQLEQELDDIVGSNQQYIDMLEQAAKTQSAEIIFYVKLYLVILAISNIFFVWFVALWSESFSALRLRAR